MATRRRTKKTPTTGKSPTKMKKVADMNKKELQAYAWENYQINLDPDQLKKDEMLKAIENLEAGRESLKASSENLEEEKTPAPAPPSRRRTAPAPSPEASIKSSPTISIANQHTGGISFPRKTDDGRPLPPLRLPPGEVTPVDREIWELVKKKEVVKHYLDKGLLAETTKRGKVPMLDNTSTTLPIPEHLQDEEQTGGTTGRAAELRKKQVGTVTLDT